MSAQSEALRLADAIDPRNEDELFWRDREAAAEELRRLHAENESLRAALAETVQEPVAIVGTQEDTWKGYGGQWAPPGPPIKMVHMLRELPEGMLLYTAPPQRKPLTKEEIIDLWAGVSDPESPDISMIDFARAVERAHGITP